MLCRTTAAAQPIPHAGVHEIVCVATACKGSKGDASIASGRHHYRVNTTGDCWCAARADNRLVYSPYYHTVITHCTMDGWHGSKNVVLIMLSDWMVSCSMHGSQRCKAKSTYGVHRQQQWLLCRWNIG